MTTWFRHMIHYQPDNRPVDLQNGKMHYHGDGALTIAYGSIRVLATTTLPWDSTRHRRAMAPSAVLVPALELDDAVLPSGTIDANVPVIAPPGLVDTIAGFGFDSIHHLDTWHQVVLRRGDASITITALPLDRTPGRDDLAMGSMLEFRSCPDATPWCACLCSGTVSPDALDDIAARFPRIDLAVVTLGCRRIADAVVGFEQERAVEFVRRTRPGLVIPIHRYDDVFTWPLRDFQRALDQSGAGACVRLVQAGTSYGFPVTTGGVQAPSMKPVDRAAARGDLAVLAGG